MKCDNAETGARRTIGLRFIERKAVHNKTRHGKGKQMKTRRGNLLFGNRARLRKQLPVSFSMPYFYVPPPPYVALVAGLFSFHWKCRDNLKEGHIPVWGTRAICYCISIFKADCNNTLGNKFQIPPAHVKEWGNGTALLKIKKSFEGTRGEIMKRVWWSGWQCRV